MSNDSMLNLAFIPLIYFFYPETKGKSLEQIDLLFSGPKILMDLPESELRRMQEEGIQRAVADNLVELTDGKDLANTLHIEAV